MFHQLADGFWVLVFGFWFWDSCSENGFDFQVAIGDDIM